MQHRIAPPAKSTKTSRPVSNAQVTGTVVETTDENSYAVENSPSLAGSVARAVKNPRQLFSSDMISLQSSVGNRAVMRLLKERSTSQITNQNSSPGMIQRFRVGEDLDIATDVGNLTLPEKYSFQAELDEKYGVDFVVAGQIYSTMQSRAQIPSEDKAQNILIAIKILLINNKAIRIFADGDQITAKVKSLFFDIQKDNFSTPRNPMEPFAREVLQRSGWLQEALALKTAKLSTDFKKTDITDIQSRYKQNSADPEAMDKPLNKDYLRKELPGKLIAVLEDHDPGKFEAIDVPLDQTIKNKARLVQENAFSLFSPFSQSASTPFAVGQNSVHGWKYEDKVVDLQQEIIPEKSKLDYLENRAYSSEVGVLPLADFNSKRDTPILEQLVKEILKLSGVDELAERHLKTTTRTDPSKTVHINTKLQKKPEGLPGAQWDTIYTLCHELMHVMVHPKFNSARSEIENGQVIAEGFVELLGMLLYNSILQKALANQEFKNAITDGLASDELPAKRERSQMGYGEDAQKAAAVFDKVGEKRVLTAFFLGKPELIGIGKDSDL